jgi:hypothetical protein
MGFLKKLFSTPSPTPAQPQAKKEEPQEEKDMKTVPQNMVLEPFSKLNYWALPNGGKRVRAYILMEQSIEGAQTGVAIDGSGSMSVNFGQESLRQVRDLNQQDKNTLVRAGLTDLNNPKALAMLVQLGVLKMMPAGKNIVQEQARDMTAYLSKFDADGGTTVIYWATGDGKQIEVINDFTGEQCKTAIFEGPKAFGRETHLLPAIQYFVSRFEDAKWGLYIFITDGQIHDLDGVKRYCTQLARDISTGRRNGLKCVLIGVGDEINEAQMEELDDLDTGTDIDLWDHKIAKEMHQLAEIFAEVVSETVILAPGQGIIRDVNGSVLKDYRDTGLPALIVFETPPNCNEFTLEIGDMKVTQQLPAY